MKNKKILYILIPIVALLIFSCLFFFCIHNNTKALPSNFIVQDIKCVDMKMIENNAQDIINEQDGKTYVIKGKFANIDGEYTINIKNDNKTIIRNFNTWPFWFERPYRVDGENIIYYDESLEAKPNEIKNAYIKFDKELNELLNELNIESINWFEVYVDSELKLIDKLPSAKEINDKFLNEQNFLYYYAEIVDNNNTKLIMTIVNGGYYKLGINITNTDVLKK